MVHDMSGPALALPEYTNALRAVLETFSDEVREKLRHVLDAMPATAREVGLDVFPHPDGEGTFDVWVRLDGPDAYVLNTAIDPWRYLLGVVWTTTGSDPELPRLRKTLDVDVHDVVVDVAADWVESLWRGAPRDARPPYLVDGERGFGASTPR